jgi:hypothetical protein
MEKRKQAVKARRSRGVFQKGTPVFSAARP